MYLRNAHVSKPGSVSPGMWRFCGSSASSGGAGADPAPAAARAFTLVELLVVIGVVAILMAVTIPAIGRARIRAVQTDYASTARQLNAALSAYTTDYDSTFPYFGVPGDPDAPLTFLGWRPLPPFSYFTGQSWHWVTAIAPEYYDAPRDPRINPLPDRYSLHDESAPEGVIRSLFAMTHAAFARPQYLATDEDPRDPAMLRPTHVGDVLYPASKALFLHVGTEDYGIEFDEHDRSTWKALFGLADGSAHYRIWYRGGSALPPGEQERLNRLTVPFRDHGFTPFHGLGTRYGMAGRDF